MVPGSAAPTLAELRRLMQDRGVADYKLPDRLELTDQLPLTNLGKVNKAALRERATRLVR